MNVRELIHSGKNLIIAHRGASHYAPENTFAAFDRAIEMNADMIELDVQLTADHIPVVFHDDELSRITGRQSLIRETGYAELKEMDAGSGFSPAFSDQHIPALSEVLERYGSRIAINIELKTPDSGLSVEETRLFAKKVIAEVRHAGMENHILFSCFDQPLLTELHKLAPEIARSLLCNRHERDAELILKRTRDFDAIALHTHWWNLKRPFLKAFTEMDLPVFIYTVNIRWYMNRLFKKGVRGIFTDRPDLKNSHSG